MPIDLSNLQSVNTGGGQNTTTYSPKFFDKCLTGSGKKQGILNENMNPMQIPPKTRTTLENRQTKKTSYVNGQTTTRLIPFSPLTYDIWSYMHEWPIMPQNHRVKIGEILVNNCHTQEFWVGLDAHSIVIDETDLGNAGSGAGSKKSRRVQLCYQIWLYVINDSSQTTAKTENDLSRLLNRPSIANNACHFVFDCNPALVIKDWMTDIMNQFPTMKSDQAAVNDFLSKFSSYSAVCRRSEEWQTTIDQTLDFLFAETIKNHIGDNAMLNQLCHELRNIETYAIPLDIYRKIYTSIQTNFAQHQDVAAVLCRQNLNLLLSDTLNHLDANKASLMRIPAPTPEATQYIANSRFSTEQQNAIVSQEPLILVQAGAGTGKSTTILGRVDYMIATGVNPEDITVLSFTNAAADHIIEKNPRIHSMTIARMIHTIYEANYPQHELSSIETVINSLDIYYPTDDIAARFRKGLVDIKRNEPDAFTWMNNFVESNFQAVMDIMDTIKQTTLDLEIIICYQQIGTMVEPPEVQTKHLIIDEVQDNSIFEFIYSIKYTDKHQCSMYIVGDCSQTLYEFRSSNPKALNVLEGSGVFQAYQLQTNYRSNQEILDFANVALNDIEANQYARIQLQANSLVPVTEQSFTDKVKFKYYQLGKIRDFENTLPAIIKGEMKKYLDACLARGESVTFLAYTRRAIKAVQDVLKEVYPTSTILSLVPEKQYNSTIISDFVKRYWDTLQFAPTANVIHVIRTEIDAHIPFMYGSNKALDKIQMSAARIVYGWAQESGLTIQDWQTQVANNQMTQQEFMDNVRETLLSYEIRNNAVRQSLLSSRNAEQKRQQQNTKANFYVSTIHSAKGLEFDNVVVLYQNKRDMEEADKRMYYVAFTRAMQSEFIAVYDTIKNPKIEADYKTIVDRLHQIAPIQNAAANLAATAQSAVGQLPTDPAARAALAAACGMSVDDFVAHCMAASADSASLSDPAQNPDPATTAGQDIAVDNTGVNDPTLAQDEPNTPDDEPAGEDAGMPVSMDDITLPASLIANNTAPEDNSGDMPVDEPSGEDNGRPISPDNITLPDSVPLARPSRPTYEEMLARARQAGGEPENTDQ